MEIKKHITAEWARMQATNIIGDSVRKELENILGLIEERIKYNQLSLSHAGSLQDLTKKELVKRGFKLEWIDGDFRDPREYGYYTISW